MADRKRLVATLAGAYGFYDRELTDFHLRVWSEALDGIDSDTIDTAFGRHLRDHSAGRFCPKPADILRQIHGDVEERALIAWGQVIAAARSGGARFDGPTQDAIDAMGGMARVRFAPESENGHLQRQFVANFKAYLARSEAPPLLPSESAAVSRGLPHETTSDETSSRATRT